MLKRVKKPGKNSSDSISAASKFLIKASTKICLYNYISTYIVKTKFVLNHFKLCDVLTRFQFHRKQYNYKSINICWNKLKIHKKLTINFMNSLSKYHNTKRVRQFKWTNYVKNQKFTHFSLSWFMYLFISIQYIDMCTHYVRNLYSIDS